MSHDGERLATLEARDNELFRKLAEHDTDLKAARADTQAIRADVHAIREQLSGYRGVAVGVWLAIGAFGGLIGAAASTLWHKLTP